MAKKKATPARASATPSKRATKKKTTARPAARPTAAKKSAAVKPAVKKTTKAKPAPRAGKNKSTTESIATKPSSARQLGKTVDDYVASLVGWQKECIAKLRDLVRRAVPHARESIKWGQPVYEHKGPFAWIKAHAKHVNLGFWRGAELPDPRKILSGAGNKMRHIKLAGLADAAKHELHELVRLAAQLNETKGDPTRSGEPKKKKTP